MKHSSYICDRCGETKVGHPMVDAKAKTVEVKDVGWVALRGSSGYSRDLDLCEGCLKSFGEWLAKKS